MQNLYLNLQNVLQKDQHFVVDGNILKNKVVECALNLNPNLIKLLLQDASLKEAFFLDIDDALIFNQLKFQQFVSNENFLPNSYTRFKQNVGLTYNNNYISSNNDVVLTWPYKDCLLEGGQTKEDQERPEVLWNETLAPNEIDRLKEPKVFVNFIKHDEKGTHDLNTFDFNDNFIIKGNNLLTLYSLTKVKSVCGKVKLIYIDPPYYFVKTKPSDSFKYNTNFKLSNWLTFMKDRLRVAKELLAPNGAILVHMSEDGAAYIKILMNEIFKPENFVETFIWRNTDNPDSISKKSRAAVEYIICFENKKNSSAPYKGKDSENGDQPLLNSGNSIHELKFKKGVIHFNSKIFKDSTIQPGKYGRVEVITPIEIANGINNNDVILKGEFKWGQQTLNGEIEKETYFLIKSKEFSIRFQRKNAVSMAPEKFIDNQYLSKVIGVGTNEDASSHLSTLGIDFNNPKPESVVAFFLRAITQPGDLVLDFFNGSGTTTAVAHKMGRRYIGCEQMDSQINSELQRMDQVIQGEQGEISSSVHWKGGGSYVYCELAALNENYIKQIISSQTSENLESIWNKIKDSDYFSYKIEPNKIDSSISEFKELTVEQQKQFLIEALDANMLYIPYSEIENEDYNIDKKDKAFNSMIYGKA